MAAAATMHDRPNSRFSQEPSAPRSAARSPPPRKSPHTRSLALAMRWATNTARASSTIGMMPIVDCEPSRTSATTRISSADSHFGMMIASGRALDSWSASRSRSPSTVRGLLMRRMRTKSVSVGWRRNARAASRARSLSATATLDSRSIMMPSPARRARKALGSRSRRQEQAAASSQPGAQRSAFATITFRIVSASVCVRVRCGSDNIQSVVRDRHVLVLSSSMGYRGRHVCSRS